MPVRSADATWEGGLREGKGSFSGESGTIRGSYSFGSRFADSEAGTNPEELLAAAHASCYSMALSGILEKAGKPAERIRTEAACTVEKVGEGFTITTMRLKVRARVPTADADAFARAAEDAKKGCPVSRALTGLDLQLDAELE